MDNTLDQIFGEVIHSYSRKQALEDGVLVSGMEGDFEDISRQHFKFPVAMTIAVFSLIEKAVLNKRHCNDFKGVYHDILFMSKSGLARAIDRTTNAFEVIITGCGHGRKPIPMKIVCGPGDQMEPVLTVMLINED